MTAILFRLQCDHLLGLLISCISQLSYIGQSNDMSSLAVVRIAWWTSNMDSICVLLKFYVEKNLFEIKNR